MADNRVRELEQRWRASGSTEDEAALLVERIRIGLLSSPRLCLAVYLGHEAAARAAAALGYQTRPQRTTQLTTWVNGLRSFRASSQRVPRNDAREPRRRSAPERLLREEEEGFYLRIVLGALHAARPLWDEHLPLPPRARALIEAIEAWAAHPDAATGPRRNARGQVLSWKDPRPDPLRMHLSRLLCDAIGGPQPRWAGPRWSILDDPWKDEAQRSAVLGLLRTLRAFGRISPRTTLESKGIASSEWPSDELLLFGSPGGALLQAVQGSALSIRPYVRGHLHHIRAGVTADVLPWALGGGDPVHARVDGA